MTAVGRSQPVGIVGLGLIGGCLGLDLQEAGAEVHALVHRPATADRARQRGLASRVDTDPAVLADCGLVILALPLDRLLDPDPGLLVGSVKQPVLAAWGPRLRHFVASHPMAGTSRSGVEAGEKGLFQGRPWVATPDAGTDPEALEAVRQLATTVGARWLCCDAAVHDRAVALISHLPVLVGAALLQTADSGGQASGLESLVRDLASSGFADTTRVGGGNPELGTLMARCNRTELLAALGRYRQAIAGLERLVELEDWQGLEGVLKECGEVRQGFLG
jgi:arogenate dehydrogenase (NADP+)